MPAKEQLTDKQSSEKNIKPQVYGEWRDRVLEAMRLLKDKKICDKEFIDVIRKLD